MPTVVADLDIESLPSSLLGLGTYRGALILLRLRGVPFGQVWLPAVDGQVDLSGLKDQAAELIDPAVWQRIVRAELEAPASEGCAALADVTVAVCTRDRPLALEGCLTALGRLDAQGHELLVVDNCPADDQTREVVSRFTNVRYVREPRPGLNHARNRALREARRSIVAFTDDDTTPDPAWLRSLVVNFDDPRVMCVTGLTMPSELETEAQELFERYSSMARGFTRVVYDSTTLSPALGGRVGVGANMAVRRGLVDDIGPFDPALDCGTGTRSGGDNEYFTRILCAGYRIVYEPAALSWHCHRASRAEVRDVMYGYGRGVYAAWTRSLLIDRELTVARAAVGWLSRVQGPGLVRALLRRPGTMPLDLLAAQLVGCASGPFAYLSSRRAAKLTTGVSDG
jgi:GT2 family glycosyltransferase